MARRTRPAYGQGADVMAKLSQAAIEMLRNAECNELADDFIVIGNIGVTVLLSHRAVADLNRQARERLEMERSSPAQPTAHDKENGK